MTALTMRLGRAPDGTMRHIPTPFVPTIVKPKGKPKRHVPDPMVTNGEAAAEQLRQFVERLERLREEKLALANDERDVFAEAKAVGYDTKGLRSILQLRRLEPHARQENDAILETYRIALGMAS